jgi:hypothetical protein
LAGAANAAIAHRSIPAVPRSEKRVSIGAGRLPRSTVNRLGFTAILRETVANPASHLEIPFFGNLPRERQRALAGRLSAVGPFSGMWNTARCGFVAAIQPYLALEEGVMPLLLLADWGTSRH